MMRIKKVGKKLDTDIRSKRHTVQKRRENKFTYISVLLAQVQGIVLVCAMDRAGCVLYKKPNNNQIKQKKAVIPMLDQRQLLVVSES